MGPEPGSTKSSPRPPPCPNLRCLVEYPALQQKKNCATIPYVWPCVVLLIKMLVHNMPCLKRIGRIEARRKKYMITSTGHLRVGHETGVREVTMPNQNFQHPILDQCRCCKVLLVGRSYGCCTLETKLLNPTNLV